MADCRSSTEIIELRAGGPGDPDERRTASVFAAYFAAEQTQVFRRLIWRRLAVVAGVVWLLEAATLVPRTALVTTLLVCGAITVGSVVAEWRCQKRLRALLDAPVDPANC